MTHYEILLASSEKSGLKIVEKNFKSDAKGLIKGNKIGIRKDLSENEKYCILAEELGHYYTSVGNILDQSIVSNRKQENAARKWAVNKLISIDMIVDACKNGCCTFFEIAEYLNVTSDFIQEALNYFKRIYGYSYKNENYTVIFNDLGFYIIN